MSCEIASCENFFAVRWGEPTADDCARILAKVRSAAQREGMLVCYLAVMPDDMPALSDVAKAELTSLSEELLPSCSMVAVALEARGFRGAIVRSAMTAITLLTRRYQQLRFVDSVEAALEACAPYQTIDRPRIAKTLREAGIDVPPSFAAAS